eukprot:TRINITY_DN4314_c0_g3_i3.p1 TRINITY_DN4314_c0_g3~~TRINITY_DN4314_c0_g3_i3.p1  ORF type:complete len:169 (-),score=14.67 TRINITY_DN4314_c0_g3_i3:189-695(-)
MARPTSPSRSRSSSRSSSSSSSSRSSSSSSRSRSADRRPRRPRSPSPVKELTISDLSRNVTAEHLREIFSTFGPLRSVKRPMDTRVNLPRGYAYVEYESRADAEKARTAMDEGQIDGRVVKINFTLRMTEPPVRRNRDYSPPSRGGRGRGYVMFGSRYATYNSNTAYD